jgi:hypothetical protein
MNQQVPIGEVHDWLRKSISSNLSQAERERDKIISEISRALESLTQTCGQLSQKAERDMEKRENRAEYRATKAVVRLTAIVSDMCKSVGNSSATDTASLRILQRQTSKLASEAAGSRQEWLRQIRPYFIIDMMTLGGHIDKIKRLGEELHNFLIGRGALLRSLEELDEKLGAYSKLALSRLTASSQKQSLQRQVGEALEEDKRLRAEAEKTRVNPRMKEYIQIDSELRSLRGELLRTGFSRLGRPLRRLISISERGDYPLPIEVREKTKEYATKPFTTFLKEDNGYPHLKTVLTALKNAVSTGKLALKQREAKKVIERAEQAVEGQSLTRLHAKSTELKRAHDLLLADTQAAALVQQLKDIRRKGKANRISLEELQDELERSVVSEKRIEEQITIQLKSIEVFLAELTGTTPRLEPA